LATSHPKLGAGTKLAYGFGLSAEGIKNNAFNLFLLFFYQQIIGLDAVLCGVALAIALVADAVLDPFIGVWSDATRSRWGRRHPFMYASLLPLAVSFYLVWRPPAGMGQMGLFVWLTTWAIATRFAMSLFTIPHQSMSAELTADSAERTQLISLRTLFAWAFGLFNAVMGFVVFFPKSERYEKGLLDPSGYPRFALFGACVILISTALSALGTQRATLARQRAHTAALPLRELPRLVREAFGSTSYRACVLGGLFLFLGFGLNENMGNYLNTYFWKLSSEQIAIFIPVILVASLTVFALAGRLSTRFDKRRLAMAAALGTCIFGPTFVLLRLAGMLPTDPQRLLPILVVPVFFGYSSLIMGMVMIGSMIADVTDEHELRTRNRQEGLLFAALAFLTKASSGLGVLVAGVIVKLSGFSPAAQGGGADEASIARLGLGSAVVGVALGLITFALVRRYELGPEKHREIQRELAARADAA
jgi:glycoside/pentoside/hexuronide:cation symporter, GPH family